MSSLPTINDRFQVIAPLGRGQSTALFQAEDRVRGGLVVIRVIGRMGMDETRGLQRLVDDLVPWRDVEIQGVVPVVDIGETAAGDLFVATGWMAGGSLAERMGKQQFEPAEANRLLNDLLEIIAAVSRAGLVFGSLKPDNILFDAEERPVIDPFSFRHERHGNPYLVLPGLPHNLAAYGSPERIKGEPLTEKSDIYTLGLIYFELVSGRRPFVGDSPVGVMMQQLNDPPPPLDQVPSPLNNLIQKMLAKAPADRPTAHQAIHFLSTHLTE